MMDPSSVKRRLTCILATDAVGYSKQMAQDEEGTIRVLAAHRAVIDGIITFHQGRIISTAGDSVLAEFSSAVEAVRCAVEIQEALKTRNDSLPEHRRMYFRVGVNLGDVVVKNEDLLGDGVNVAARLESVAEPGGICISSSVYDQITGKLDLGFQDIGEQTLKNISRPIRVYRVSGAAAPLPPAPAAPPAARSRTPVAWAAGMAAVFAVGAAVAWQGGWLRSGPPDGAGRTTASAPVSPASAPMAPTAPPVESKASPGASGPSAAPPADSEAQRVRADAEAMKRQAEAELARARSEVEASRAARVKAEADAAAGRLRADAEAVKRQAEADAARIRAEANAAAARARAEADAATRAAAAQAAKAAPAPAAIAPGAPGAANRFDGVWNVTINCPKIPETETGFTQEFLAQVKDGLLQGDHGREGAPGSLRLQGEILADGSAKLDAKGLTGHPRFNIKGVPQGLPYGYQVAARFEGTRGTGRRMQVRPCDLTFVKQ